MQTHEIRMLCLQCKECCLCMDCYSINLEWKNHSPNHLQIPLNGCDSHIFCNDYSIYDMIIFIQYIRIHGFGSWQTIKNQMKKAIGVPVEQYIYDFYTLREMQFKLFQQQFKSQNLKENSFIYNNINYLITIYNQIHPTINRTYLAYNPDSSVLGEYAVMDQLATNTGEGDGKQYVLGSWPLREEMSYEYINKAEYPVMYMKINGNDPKELFAFKLQVLQCYVYRLITRHNIKILFLKHGMHRCDGKSQDDISEYFDQRYYQDKNSLHYLQQNNMIEHTPIPQLSPHYTEKHLIDEQQQLPSNIVDQVRKYEMHHLYLSRGFVTRQDFKTYIGNLLYERQLRIQIYQIQQQLQCTKVQQHPSIRQNQSKFNHLKAVINKKYAEINGNNYQNVPLQHQLSEIMRNFRIPGDMVNFMQLLDLNIISPGDKNTDLYFGQNKANSFNQKYITNIMHALLNSQLSESKCSCELLNGDITMCYSQYLLQLKNLIKFNQIAPDDTQSSKYNDLIFKLIMSIYSDMEQFDKETQINTFNIRYSGCFVLVGLYIALINLCVFMYTAKQQQITKGNMTDRILEVAGSVNILCNVLSSIHSQNIDFLNIKNKNNALLNIFNGTNPVLSNRMALISIHSMQQNLIEQLNCGFMAFDTFIQKNFKKDQQQNNNINYQYQHIIDAIKVAKQQRHHNSNKNILFQSEISSQQDDNKKYILRPIQLVSIVQYVLNTYGIDRYIKILDMVFPQLLGVQWPNNPFFTNDIFNMLRQNRYSIKQNSMQQQDQIFQYQLEFFIMQIQKYTIDKNSIVLLGNGFTAMSQEHTFSYLYDFINTNLSKYFTNFVYDVEFLDWFMSNPRVYTHSKRQLPGYLTFLSDKKQRVILDDYVSTLKTPKYYEKRQQILSQQQFVTVSFTQDDYYNLISFLNNIVNYTENSLENINVIINSLKQETGMIPIFNHIFSNVKLSDADVQKIIMNESKILKNQQTYITLQEIAFLALTNIPMQTYQRYKAQFYFSGCIITDQLLTYLNSNKYLNEACALVILSFDSQVKHKITKAAQNKTSLTEKDYYISQDFSKTLQMINYTLIPQSTLVKDVDNHMPFYQQMYNQINNVLNNNQLLSIMPPPLIYIKEFNEQRIQQIKDDLFPSFSSHQDFFQ